jgi:hypothetical protein
MRGTRLSLSLVVIGGLCLAALAGAHTRAQEGRGAAGAARHASLTEGLDCANCHTTASWDMAGGASAGRGFDHARTGFPLSGRHASSTCAECHRPDLAIRRECAACHEDDHHAGRMGRACDACHTSTTWNDTRSLEIHRTTRLPLTGMHALADCTECHGRVGERAYSATPADCFACHEGDYRRSDVHPIHVGTTDSEPFPRDCGLCHVATGWAPALFDPSTLAGAMSPLTLAPPEHEVVFPIRRGPHRGAPCTSCHVIPDLPRAVECVGCHTHDPVTLQRQHPGQLISPDAASCLGCHPGGMSR